MAGKLRPARFYVLYLVRGLFLPQGKLTLWLSWPQHAVMLKGEYPEVIFVDRYLWRRGYRGLKAREFQLLILVLSTVDRFTRANDFLQLVAG